MKYPYSIIYTFLCFALLFQVSCRRGPDILEYPPFMDMPFDRNSIFRVPVIVVARLNDVVALGQPRQPQWGQTSPVQLYEADIQIENVLAGKVAEGRQKLYFFVTAGAWDGPARLGLSGQTGRWHRGDREIFFLRPDHGVLRTICDDLAYCVVQVLSGPHPTFKRQSGRWVGDELSDILLDRGSGCTDFQLAIAVERSSGVAYSFSGSYALSKLKTIASSNNGALRTAACQMLSSFESPFCTTPTNATKDVIRSRASR